MIIPIDLLSLIAGTIFTFLSGFITGYIVATAFSGARFWNQLFCRHKAFYMTGEHMIDTGMRKVFYFRCKKCNVERIKYSSDRYEERYIDAINNYRRNRLHPIKDSANG